MSDTILTGDFTVYYVAENRQKRIEWSGAATDTRTCNELYSALQDLFDELTQMDDGTPMSAQTPTEYTIGIIDPGDSDPWFIDRTTVEHLTGGALKTASWNRVVTTNTGIVRMGYTQTVALVPGDIGKTIVMTTDGDSGTIVDYNSTDLVIWIRPDTSAAGDSFDDAPTTNGAWTVTGGTGTGNQSGGAASTGESLWANIFSIGTIAANTHLYVQQDGSLLTAYKGTSDWWADGQIDILINVSEVGTEVDEAVVRVFARRYTATYDHFETDLSAGGRNPIPLATGTDLDNTTGYRSLLMSSDSGNFSVGDRISHATNVLHGIITEITGTTPTRTLKYYLAGDPLSDFSDTDTVTNMDDTGTGTVNGAPSNNGPATLTGISITHSSNETFDVDEDGTTENYSIVIDCSDELLADMYEWTKYLTRRGETSTGNTDGVQGQFYIGSTVKVEYTSVTGTVAEGDVVTQENTGATGTVLSHNTTDDIVILRTTRGTFNTTDDIAENPGVNELVGPHTITVLTPVKAAPFGTFAGGTWFCAPGVVLDNVPNADANNYQLTSDDGTVVVAPNKVDVTVANTRALDRIAVFRLTGAGGDIDKSEYTVNADAAAGATSITVTPAITADTPGRTAGGILRAVDVSAEEEYRIRFSSWSGSVFTLASQTLTPEAGTDTDTIVDTGAFGSTLVGDLVYNSTQGAYSYVSEVTDANTIQISPAISGQTQTDSIAMNQVPVALEDATPGPADTLYVPLLDVHETTGTGGAPGSESVNITYVSDIEVRVRARQGKVILPYEADATVTSTGLTNNVIRTADTIAT